MFSPELAPAIVSNPAAVIAGTAGGAAAGMAGRIGASLFGASLKRSVRLGMLLQFQVRYWEEGQAAQFRIAFRRFHLKTG